MIFARRGFVGLSLLGVAAPLLPEDARAQVPVWLLQPPPSGPPNASQILANFERVYNRLSTFRAFFRQRYSIYSHNARDSVGTVDFERPDKMSWSYASGNRVISDGQLIRIYEKANRQMYVRPFNRTQYPVALSFLMGQQSNLNQTMSFSLLSSAVTKYATGHVLMGVPLQPSPAFARVLYYVNGTTFQVHRVLIEDQQRNRNRYDFRHVWVNQPIAPGTFVFTPPPGTQVIQP